MIESGSAKSTLNPSFSLRRWAPLVTLAGFLFSETSAPHKGGDTFDSGINSKGQDLSSLTLPARPNANQDWKQQVISTNVPSALVTLAQAESNHIQWHRTQEKSHLYAGLPLSTGKTLVILTNTGYISAYDLTTKNPAYVAYRLFKIGEPKEHGVAAERASSFKRDPRLPKNFINANPLDLTGYDHGHLAPSYAIGSRYGQAAQNETFTVTDISPQLPSFNRSTWKYLEYKEADIYANAYDEIWVITGPIFDSKHEYIQKNKIEIPDAFFKIMIDERDSDLRSLTFIINQDSEKTTNFVPFLSTIRRVQEMTGINFNVDLPDIIEHALESEKATELWDIPTPNKPITRTTSKKK